jgi:copper(I)-binding protein
MSELGRLAACVLLLAGCERPPEIHVERCSARVFGKNPGVAYCELSNRGGSDVLVSVDSPAAAHVELHEIRRDGTVARMRELRRGLPIPAYARVRLEPGARHLMLRGVQLEDDAHVLPLRLHFMKSGAIEVAARLTTDAQP